MQRSTGRWRGQEWTKLKQVWSEPGKVTDSFFRMHLSFSPLPYLPGFASHASSCLASCLVGGVRVAAPQWLRLNGCGWWPAAYLHWNNSPLRPLRVYRSSALGSVVTRGYVAEVLFPVAHRTPSQEHSLIGLRVVFFHPLPCDK